MAVESPYSFLQIKRAGAVGVVRFTGKAMLDENSIRLVGDELIRLVDKFGYKKILLDFRQVKNLGSYMLATLVDLHKKIQSAEGRLALCSIDAEVYQVFQLTRLTKILSIYPSEKEALASFN
jgi:anti-anti-sigma factor